MVSVIRTVSVETENSHPLVVVPIFFCTFLRLQFAPRGKPRKESKMQKITSNTIYSELKAMVPDRTADTTPKGKTLIKSEEAVLISVKEDGKTITVYENGFFTYQDEEERVTARAVWNCSQMRYKDVLGNIETVSEEHFSDLPFPIVLAHFGDRNIEWQIEDEKRRNQGLSLDGGEVNLHGSGKEGVKKQIDQGLVTPDFSDVCDRELDGEPEVDAREQMISTCKKAWAKLTEKQREAMTLCYVEGLTQEEAAVRLGIGQRSISDRIEGALKKLKKFL